LFNTNFKILVDGDLFDFRTSIAGYLLYSTSFFLDVWFTLVFCSSNFVCIHLFWIVDHFRCVHVYAKFTSIFKHSPSLRRNLFRLRVWKVTSVKLLHHLPKLSFLEFYFEIHFHYLKYSSFKSINWFLFWFFFSCCASERFCFFICILCLLVHSLVYFTPFAWTFSSRDTIFPITYLITAIGFIVVPSMRTYIFRRALISVSYL
jgi:hypothetical protein